MRGPVKRKHTFLGGHWDDWQECGGCQSRSKWAVGEEWGGANMEDFVFLNEIRPGTDLWRFPSCPTRGSTGPSSGWAWQGRAAVSMAPSSSEGTEWKLLGLCGQRSKCQGFPLIPAAAAFPSHLPEAVTLHGALESHGPQAGEVLMKGGGGCPRRSPLPWLQHLPVTGLLW